MEPAQRLPIFSSNHKLIEALHCPVLNKPFEKAQIVNCRRNHSFSLSVAEDHFGKMQTKGVCERPGPCYICRGRVTAFWPNPTLQKLVDATITAASEKGREILKPIKVVSNGNYPLNKAVFNLQKELDFDGEFWELTFNHSNSSRIQSICMNLTDLGYASLTLSLSNALTAQSLQKFFQDKHLSFKIYEGSKLTFEQSNEPEKLVQALGILRRNNDFDAASLRKINSFIQKIAPPESQKRKSSTDESKENYFIFPVKRNNLTAYPLTL